MGWIGEQIDSIKAIQIRQQFTQVINLGLIITSALIIWKGLMCITGSESPVVVVLSGSMEPGFRRGDILFLHMSKDPIRAGEIVVFNIDRLAAVGVPEENLDRLQPGLISYIKDNNSRIP